jgi:hypothetical protein
LADRLGGTLPAADEEMMPDGSRLEPKRAIAIDDGIQNRVLIELA